MRPLVVKQITIAFGPNKGVKAWGVTDGKKWHVYAFADKQRAETMAANIGDDEVSRMVNVGYPAESVMLKKD